MENNIENSTEYLKKDTLNIKVIYEENIDRKKKGKDAIVLCCAKISLDARDYNMCMETLI